MKHPGLTTTIGLILACGAAPLAASTVQLIAPGSEWRYLDDGSDASTAWREPLFDDSAWPVGPAQLGYGDGDETTIVRCRAPWPAATPCPAGGEADRIVTTYFRRAFQVADPAAFDALTLRLLQDDGAVVYLNGQEVVRANLPGGEVLFDTPALQAVFPENVFTDHALASAALAAGSNLLAVEVHQRDPGSSDVSFDLELVASAPGLPQLVRGPYLQLGTPTSAVLRWRTDTAVSSRLEYGSSPDDLSHAVVDPTPKTEHAVAVGGLAAGTRHFYALGTAVETLLPADPERSFTTAPPPGTPQRTRIWVIGDSGTANADAAAVRDAYRRFAGGAETDLWLMLGDNAYPDGTDEQYQAAVFDTYPLLLRRSWLWPTIGNHDAHSLDIAAQAGPYFDIFSLPTAAQAGGLATGTEAYYSFDYANVHFICLDSVDSERSPGSAMLQWLEADAAATLQDWIVAFWHHSPYTKGSHDSDLPADSQGRLFDMRENVLPILEAAGVDLVLTGHSHSYERSMLLSGHYDVSDTLTGAMIVDEGDGRPGGDGAYAKDSRGAVYVVAGSSGRLGGGTLDHPAMWTSLARLGSLVLDIEGLRLDAVFLDEAGEIGDELTIFKARRLFADGFESGDVSAW